MTDKPDIKALRRSRQLLDELGSIGSESAAFKRGRKEQRQAIDVGKSIRRLRIERGITQRELALLAGMSQSDVSRIEAGTGSQGPSIETIVRLGQALLHRVSVNFEPMQHPDGKPDRSDAAESGQETEGSGEKILTAN
jgi:transcriptional regulator with XRE-family HTH domain